jgi:hypothetical protein
MAEDLRARGTRTGLVMGLLAAKPGPLERDEVLGMLHMVRDSLLQDTAGLDAGAAEVVTAYLTRQQASLVGIVRGMVWVIAELSERLIEADPDADPEEIIRVVMLQQAADESRN